jgi:hypothetical protein
MREPFRRIGETAYAKRVRVRPTNPIRAFPRPVLSTLLAALGVFAAACNPLGGSEATPEICVDAWNRGTKDGAPYPEGSINPSSAGISYGFIGRRAAVLSSGDCTIVFDLGSEVYEFHSVSTGEQPPFGPSNPGLAGWLTGRDVQPPDYFEVVEGSWNACQNSDGTLVLLSKGACAPLDPDVRPAPIKEWLDRKAARNFVAGRKLLPRNKAGFWLGPRFRGSVAEVQAADPRLPQDSMPADAAYEAFYYPWRGLRPTEWRRAHQRLRIAVLTYTGRLKRLPQCLERVPGPTRCVEPFRPLLRFERNGQTVVVVATNANRIPAPLVADIRRNLTSQPGYSEAELEATEHQDSGLPAGFPFGRRPD